MANNKDSSSQCYLNTSDSSVNALADSISKLKLPDLRALSESSVAAAKLKAPDLIGTLSAFEDSVSKLKLPDLKALSESSVAVAKLKAPDLSGTLSGFDRSVSSVVQNMSAVLSDFSAAMSRIITLDYSTAIASLKESLSSVILNFSFLPLPKLGFESVETIINVANNVVEQDRELDETEKQSIEQTVLSATYGKSLTVRQKKNWFVYILTKLWKILDRPKVALILALLIFGFQTVYQPKQAVMRETKQQIIIIEKETQQKNLRGITKNNTKILVAPKGKSEIVDFVDCGDIVEVIEVRDKWLKIRVYQTDTEGWILKKYTKA